MSMARTFRWANKTLLLLGALPCLSLALTTASAQTLDLDSGPAKAAPAVTAKPSTGGLDTDVNPSAPIGPATASSAAPPRDAIQAGVAPLGPKPGAEVLAPAPPNPSPGTVVVTAPASLPAPVPTPSTGPESAPVTTVAAPPSPAEPIALAHPRVIDTAKLQAGETTVSLFGIEGIAGPSAQGLQGYLAANGDKLNCQARESAAFVCLMTDGTDVAQVSLRNGAARTKVDAPDAYRTQEIEAQKDRLGIWNDLPPPPETVKHPLARDTATLLAERKTFALNGIVGMAAPYNSQLQGYIAGNGDSMTCLPQGSPEHFVCLLPDGTDIAKVALVNGAARVTAEAPESYRAQQREAVNNKRGYWGTVRPEVLTTAMVLPPVSEQYTFVVGDIGFEGLSYIGGAPVVTILGEPEPVFLIYSAGPGWGYYGRDHYWHRAPDRYWHHMDHYHPGGRGLHGYDQGRFVARGHDVGGRAGLGGRGGMGGPAMAGHPGAGGPGMAAQGGMGARPGALAGAHGPMAAAGRPGMGGARPGMTAARPGGGGFMRPAPTASAGGFRPGGMPGGGLRPGGMGGGGFHPGGMAGGGLHPGGMAGGGFHPGGMGGGGFHPGGGGGMAHVSAPAAPPAHVGGGGGAGVRHK